MLSAFVGRKPSAQGTGGGGGTGSSPGRVIGPDCSGNWTLGEVPAPIPEPPVPGVLVITGANRIDVVPAPAREVDGAWANAACPLAGSDEDAAAQLTGTATPIAINKTDIFLSMTLSPFYSWLK